MKKLIASGCKKPDKTPGRIRHQYRSPGSSNVRAYRALQLLASSASFSFFFLCLCFSGSSPRATFIIIPKIRPAGEERSRGHLQEAPASVIATAAPGSAPPALPSTHSAAPLGSRAPRSPTETLLQLGTANLCLREDLIKKKASDKQMGALQV